MPEQSRTVKRAFAKEYQMLQEISDALAKLDISQDEYANELYHRAMGIMIAVAPTHFHTVWHLIEMNHLHLRSQKIIQLTRRDKPTAGELTEEEERLYQKAISEL